MRALVSGNLQGIDLAEFGENSNVGFQTVKSLLMFPDDAEQMVVPFVRNIISIVQMR